MVKIKTIDINKIYGKLKMKCFEMPNASYTNRCMQLKPNSWKLNWIIKNRSKLDYHTNLNVLLKPIEKDIQNLKWLISDLEINTSEMEKLPINHQKDWFLISSQEMKTICETDTQIVWGAFSGIDKSLELILKK